MPGQQVHPTASDVTEDEHEGAKAGGSYDVALQNPAMVRDVGKGRFRGAHCLQMKETQRVMKTSSWWFVFAASTSLAAILVGVLVAELEHFEDRYDSKRQTMLDPIVMTLKFCLASSSAVTIGALSLHYNGLVKLAKLQGLYLPSSANFFIRLARAGLLEDFLIDVVSHLIFPWPFVHFDFEIWDQVIHEYSRYCIVDVLVIAMFLRFILLPRLFCLFHDLNSEEARVYGRFISLDVGKGTITKVLLNESLSFLLGVWIICICTFSYTLYLFERDYAFQNGHEHGGLGSFRNCIWLSIVTMTTIGIHCSLSCPCSVFSNPWSSLTFFLGRIWGHVPGNQNGADQFSCFMLRGCGSLCVDRELGPLPSFVDVQRRESAQDPKECRCSEKAEIGSCTNDRRNLHAVPDVPSDKESETVQHLSENRRF
mmetsp:Transcript_29891/g.46866  ORF Transcript_29891/g.46866 Transcript_29891/m.46866 type:complete len:425 (-) Transcript_29891:489-1763(-)